MCCQKVRSDLAEHECIPFVHIKELKRSIDFLLADVDSASLVGQVIDIKPINVLPFLAACWLAAAAAVWCCCFITPAVRNLSCVGRNARDNFAVARTARLPHAI